MYHFLYGGGDTMYYNINFNDCKMKRHDENRDLRSFSRIGKVDYSSKTLQCAKSAVIGIHLWGKIDFLTKYCGWHFVWNNQAGNSYAQFNDNSQQDDRAQKKIKKEHQLTDKTKKSKKK